MGKYRTVIYAKIMSNAGSIGKVEFNHYGREKIQWLMR